jgi:hypothetical protein
MAVSSLAVNTPRGITWRRASKHGGVCVANLAVEKFPSAADCRLPLASDDRQKRACLKRDGILGGRNNPRGANHQQPYLVHDNALYLLLVFQSNGQIRIGGLDGMNNVEVTVRFHGCRWA